MKSALLTAATGATLMMGAALGSDNCGKQLEINSTIWMNSAHDAHRWAQAEFCPNGGGLRALGLSDLSDAGAQFVVREGVNGVPGTFSFQTQEPSSFYIRRFDNKGVGLGRWENNARMKDEATWYVRDPIDAGDPNTNDPCDFRSFQVYTQAWGDDGFMRHQGGGDSYYFELSPASSGHHHYGQMMSWKVFNQPKCVGFWKYLELLSGTTSYRHRVGTEKSHTYMESNSWTDSISSSVEAGLEVEGAGSITSTLSSTLSHEFSRSHSYYWAMSEEDERTRSYDERYDNFAVFQWWYDSHDAYGNTFTTKADDLALMDCRGTQPRCLPGYSPEVYYRQCGSMEFIMPGFPGNPYEWKCDEGQGAKNRELLVVRAEEGGNHGPACAAACADHNEDENNIKCEAFDYTRSIQSDTCRLYGSDALNSPRLGNGGSHNREYCRPKTAA